MKGLLSTRLTLLTTLFTSLLLLTACGGGSTNDGSSTTPELIPGALESHSMGNTTLNMRYVPASGFRTGVQNDGSSRVTSEYWMSETEITYELWKKVYDWATTDVGNGRRADFGLLYDFQNPGRQGGDTDYACASPDVLNGTPQHPVTCISWRDAMVWMNALTEYNNAVNATNYRPVYYSDPSYNFNLRSSVCVEFYCNGVDPIAGSFDQPYIDPNATGFRLPSSAEWELAARYKYDINADGDVSDTFGISPTNTIEYYPGNFASGADTSSEITTGASDFDGDGDVEYSADVAVYNTTSTAAVKSKSPNRLGLYDMSGNLWEWNFDWEAAFLNTARVIRGGAWNGLSNSLQIGSMLPKQPYLVSSLIGFRAARRNATLKAGEQVIHTAAGIDFGMRYVPAMSFKTGEDDSGTATVSNAYWLAETEVTYELWKTVYDWAAVNGYTFANAGTMGDGVGDNNQHPVTTINWRDSIVWMNALTEWYNAKTGASHKCVYTSDFGYTTPIRNSTDGAYSLSLNETAGSFDNPYINPTAKGFRLPTGDEWELAARFKYDINSDGDILDRWGVFPNEELEYYPGNFASGASGNYSNTAATDTVAWYLDNSGGSTHPVGQLSANILGLYDVSGNVGEMVFDNLVPGSSNRLILGGNLGISAIYLQVGYRFYGTTPYSENSGIGFRITMPK